MQLVLTPQLVLEAYRQGLFPMAYSAYSPYIQWICPEHRGLLPIREFHIGRSLSKVLRRALKESDFSVRINTAFHDVISACAEPSEKRPETWINDPIRSVFSELHAQGYAHSVECWQTGSDGTEHLVGGLYGLALGRVFCAESMFSRQPNASKIALAALVARLWRGGFHVLDTQFSNPHLEQFGAHEIPYKEYKRLLERYGHMEADFLQQACSGAPADSLKLLEDYMIFRGLLSGPLGYSAAFGADPEGCAGT